MEFLIINGNPDDRHQAWEQYLKDWTHELTGSGARAEMVRLRDMDIRYCTGCFSCWWATPGLCGIKDELPSLYPRMLHADVVVWASPLVMGNVSALTKKVQDRFIPLLHPFIEITGGECHHRRRYDKDINMGLVVGTGSDDATEDVEIVRHQHERLALNGRGRLVFSLGTDTAVATAAELALIACRSLTRTISPKEHTYEKIGA